MKKLLLFTSLYFSITPLILSSPEQPITQIRKGNLALPISQQPAPLFCFGQNILEKGDLQLFIYSDQLKGKNSQFNSLILNALYGISDTFSVYGGIPIALKWKDNNYCSSGIQDLFLQFEYAFFYKFEPAETKQATFVVNILFPTGSSTDVPATGYGSPSFFLGTTASYLSIEWYLFASPGILLTTPHHNTQFGNEFFYQWGIGKNISYSSEKWIFTGILEFTGHYVQKNKIAGVIDQNSGGNTIFLGPSLWFSTQRFFIQAGIIFPIFQHLFGIQNKSTYLAAIDFGWTF